MGKFDGKVLLELGTSIGSIDIVKYAKSEGAYVIVTDYLPYEKSAAKHYADEHSVISTLDVDAITEYAKSKKIDGIFCGVSEANINTCAYVARKLNLPIYFTDEQWQILQNKSLFKSLCRKCGVPVVPEYSISDIDNLDYPILLKPVDGSGAHGVNVCYNRADFDKLYAEALKYSASKEVLLEKYINSAHEVFFQYTIQNGICSLTSCFTKVFTKAETNNDKLILPLFHMYPSCHLPEYYETFHEKVLELFKSINIKNGVMTIQSFFKDGNFYVFEAGYRLGGAQNYIFSDYQNGTNCLKYMVNYALTGKMSDINILEQDNPYFDKPCCNYYIGLESGKIESMTSAEIIRKMPGVINVTELRRPGDEIEDSNALNRICYRLHVVGNDKNDLANNLVHISKNTHIISNKGNDMKLEQLTFDRCISAINDAVLNK